MDYLSDVISKTNEKGMMLALELAVDEEHNQIAILNKNINSNGNYKVRIYKLSDFIKGKKTILNTFYLKSKMCGEGKAYCSEQGTELYGNYFYTIQEVSINDLHHESITKIKYKTCSTEDVKGAKCEFEELNIPGDKIGTEYGKGVVGINEIEGISISKGKVYASVMTNAFSDGTRRNTTILLDGF